MPTGISLSGRLKEFLRPYYLRWIYFRLAPHHRPRAFQDCWQYPFCEVGPSARLPQSAADLPDLLFYPMTDWHTRIQRTQHLARALRDLGYRCIYVNPHLGREFETTPLFGRSHRLAQLEENIFELHIRLPREPVFHHRLLTAREEDIIASAIRQILPARAHAVQIVSFPLWLGVARRFRHEAAFPIVYDCHDLLSGFHNIAADILSAETTLFREADLVLFSSGGLAGQYASVTRRWRLLRNAVDPALVDTDAAPPAGPLIAGYLGALDSWFDAEAIRESASLNPQCRFILAGRVEFEPITRLQLLPNVELMGEIPYDQVAKFLSRLRIGLIPFQINPLTLMTNPIKLYEYFSRGLPVVTAPLPEAEPMRDLVYPAATAVEFARQVSRALAEDDPRRRAHRQEIARGETWPVRAREISTEIAKLVSAKSEY